MALTSARLQQLVIPASATAALLGLATVALFAANKKAPPQSRSIIPSPRTTLLPRLSEPEASQLPYPPDFYPGSRDVVTPYGTMRVYEFGPETGRKVIFVHGDGTPSPLFSSIARDLVAKGCRVILLDLWGRGYSDTPLDTQHDSRLYTLQISFALLSSPLPSWTTSKFSLIGFSMGCSIVLDFFSHNSERVEGIVLLGPGGLIRKLPAEYCSLWYQYPGLVSTAKMRRLLATTLGIEADTQDKLVFGKFTPTAGQQFQFDHHQGHVVSFLSNIQYGPLQNQHATWKRAGDIVRGAGDAPMSQGKIVCVCGSEDDVVLAQHVQEDLGEFFGKEHFEFKTVPGGHGFPWTQGEAIVGFITDHWSL